MPSYQITAEARQDLRDIARYTFEKWGVAQSKKYRDQLGACFQAIGAGNGRARLFNEERPDLFLQREKKPPLIIAVLHELMDLARWLRQRGE